MLQPAIQPNCDFKDITPPTSTSTVIDHIVLDSDAPPSFESSHFSVIYRRVRKPVPHALKPTDVPSRFINLPNHFELSGWGSISRIFLSEEDIAAGIANLQTIKEHKVLGQFTASGIAGNDVFGSIFYSLPAVVAVGGVL
jgi:hypothetical protein